MPSAYANAVIADNPFHWWRCNEVGGLLLQDPRALTPDALFFNANGFEFMPYTGIASDGGAALVSSSGYFWDNDGLAASTPITAEAWFWQHSRIGITQVVVQIQVGGTNLIQLALTSSGVPQLNGPTGAIVGSTPATRQQWHQIAGSISNTGAAVLYLDGVSVATGSVGTSGSSVKKIAFGGVVSPAGNQFEGGLCELSLYATVLSSTRVLAHFNAADTSGTPPTFEGIGSFPISGGSGSDAANIAAILAAVSKTFPVT